MLEKAGKIALLETQARYELIPAQYVDGKCVERAVHYVADFRYVDAVKNCVVVEDTKGYRTADYIIKRKLMLWTHGIRVVEV